MELSRREMMITRYAHRSPSRKYLERAVDAVVEGRVKRHVFVPSGRSIHTVVGRNGDEFVDPEKPFCSCEHFFFRVLGNRDQSCYHLLADTIAAETNQYTRIQFHDEEFRTFLRLLSSDLLSRSGSPRNYGAEPQP